MFDTNMNCNIRCLSQTSFFLLSLPGWAAYLKLQVWGISTHLAFHWWSCQRYGAVLRPIFALFSPLISPIVHIGPVHGWVKTAWSHRSEPYLAARLSSAGFTFGLAPHSPPTPRNLTGISHSISRPACLPYAHFLWPPKMQNTHNALQRLSAGFTFGLAPHSPNPRT